MNSQKSLKIKLSLIAALALSFVIALGSFLGVTLARADRTVTVSGTSTFITYNKAEVWAHQVGEEGEGDAKKPIDYTMFVFNEYDKEKTDKQDRVRFNKNLAFKWIENDAEQTEAPKDENGGEEGKDEEEKPVAKPDINFHAKDGWFNMEIGFTDPTNSEEYTVEYKYFVITFESQQYTQTKDGKSTNYIVFAPAENNKLSVYITHKETEDKDLNAVLEKLEGVDPSGTVEYGSIKINFTKYEDGNYTVAINDGITGTFENIGKTYSKYSSSTTTPVTPLSFEAVFEDKNENEPEAHKAFLTLYSLNNQSFKLSNARASGESDGHRVGGTVSDDTPPVLCLDKAISFIKYNGEIPFDYTVIDVLASSPSFTTSYYKLTKDDVKEGNSPKYNEDGGDYKKVTDSDNQYIFPHAEHYIPQAGDNKAGVYDENYEVKGAVKVVLKLTDSTSTGGVTTYVLLDWFVEKDYLLEIGEVGKEVPYIAVTTDKIGVSYAYTKDGESNPDVTGANENREWKKIVDDYQAKVDEAAKDLKAGSKNYFYLPSAESLFNTDATPYQDLTFSIYYNHGSQQSSTGKNANELSINLTKAHKYVFTIYAKDAAGNNMYYYDGTEKTDLETGDIWNMYNQKKDSEYEGMKKYLPWFEFTVAESEISIEDPDDQSTAYVGSSFTPDSFEINGVSVKTEYTLYEFLNDEWAAKENGGKAMTFEYFSENIDALLKDSRQYFVRIRPTGDLKEGTADYDRFNDYGWNGSSLTFTPQTANSFYTIKCEARSSEIATPETAYMTIAAATKVAPLQGEDTWVQDNVTSIVLLCIAGASLIGIILLLVIKPKNKGDLDEVIESPKKKKKN